MKFIKTKPCKECPFLKKSTAGWLGPDTAESVMQKVHGEGGYHCHTSVEGGRQQKAHQCIGAVLHANVSCKLYYQPQLAELQQKLRGEEKKYKILGYQEFLDHHRLSFVERLSSMTKEG